MARSRMHRIAAALCAALASGQLLPPARAASPGSAKPGTIDAVVATTKQPSGQVFVGLLDGSLVALDADSGDELWTYSLGKPLVSSATGASVDSDAPSLFPGTDGALYYHRSASAGGAVTRLPVSVPELVDASPSVTGDGAVIVGRRTTTVHVIDARTGTLIRTFQGGSDEDEVGFDTWESAQATAEGGGYKPVYVGRKEFELRSVDLATGAERWNVTYAEVTQLGGQAGLPADPAAPAGMLGAGAGGVGGGALAARGFVAGADGKLTLRGADGEEAWSRQFDAPAVALSLREESGLVWTEDLSGRGGVRGGDVMVGELPSLGGAPTMFALPAGAGDGAEGGSQDGGGGRVVRFGNDSKLQREGSDAAGVGHLSCPPQDGPFQLAGGADPSYAFLPDLKTGQLGGNAIDGEGVLPRLGDGSAGDGAGRGLAAAFGAGTALLLAALAALVWRVLAPRRGASAGTRAREAEGTKEEPVEDSAASGDATDASQADTGGGGTGEGAGSKAAKKRARKKRAAAAATAVEVAAANTEDPQPPPASARTKPSGVGHDGRTWVGRLRIDESSALGYGANGTIVFEGEMDGRPVAVKRLLRQFFDHAETEIGTLIRADDHPNIVRCFAMEEDERFVYLALERCKSSLQELADVAASGSVANAEPAVRLVEPVSREPTALAMQLAREMVEGLRGLHARGIVHRDLKPRNILLTESGRAKLSDMGLAKLLVPDQSSFASIGVTGSSGWQAPEQVASRTLPEHEQRVGATRRLTRAVDVFSLGCVLHYVCTGGLHPFGRDLERDTNIMAGNASVVALGHMPEMQHCVLSMVQRDARDRPSIEAVAAHPCWWTAEKQLAFLIDLSNLVENDEKEGGGLGRTFEEAAAATIPGGNWTAAVDDVLLQSLAAHRLYNGGSVRDLLRVVRNKASHWNELAPETRSVLGSYPNGFVSYFKQRFPMLVLRAYYFALRHVAAQEPVNRHFADAAAAGLLSSEALLDRLTAAGKAGAKAAPPTAPPRSETAAAPGPGGRGRAAAAASAGAEASSSQRGGAAAEGPKVWEVPKLPSRPGARQCQFYIRTGYCRYGLQCQFDHPPELAVEYNAYGLPIRPGQPNCDFFLKTGNCKYGPMCKFSHPDVQFAGQLPAHIDQRVRTIMADAPSNLMA